MNEVQSPYLVVGLGNPGSRYTKTWHNCGFWQIEWLSQHLGLPVKQAQQEALIGRGRINGQPVILACPQTYMNDSGRSVAALMRYYRVNPERLMVIYDDLDTPIGHIRMRPKGGPGTHNGMRSIVASLGHGDFARLRVGIGPKPEGWDLAAYVLSNLPSQDQEAIFRCLEIGGQGVLTWINQGLEAAMNAVNRQGQRRQTTTEVNG